MAGNFTYSYVFQKNIAYAVSRANFLTYLTAMLENRRTHLKEFSETGRTTAPGLSLALD